MLFYSGVEPVTSLFVFSLPLLLLTTHGLAETCIHTNTNTHNFNVVLYVHVCVCVCVYPGASSKSGNRGLGGSKAPSLLYQLAMDPGSVLNALLARHQSYLVDANLKSALQRARKRQDVSLASARPPPKLLEAVSRGVNPLMLAADTHKAESAARERAKRRRSHSPSAVSHTAWPRRTRKKVRSEEVAAEKKPPVQPLLPSARKADLARERVVPKTLALRHRELRAQYKEEEDSRRNALSASSTSGSHQGHLSKKTNVDEGESTRSSSAHTASGAPRQPTSSTLDSRHPKMTVSPSRRDVWRRRCTTRRILRLSRGVSRAAALRRYWYTSLDQLQEAALRLSSADAAAAAAPPSLSSVPCKNSAGANDGGAASLQRQQQLAECVVCDAVEARCAARRRRAARRGVLAHFHSRKKACKATAALKKKEERVTMNVDGVSGKVRLTRRQYKADIRSTLQHADTELWSLTTLVVAERQEVLRRLTASCAAAASSSLSSDKAGVLPLLLARHFPLFGAAVEVQELEVRVRRVMCRRTRHRRRARYSAVASAEVKNHKREDNTSSTGTLNAPDSQAKRLCVLQRHRGIVMEEYSESLGVLLLPSNEDGRQAWAAAVQQASAMRHGKEGRGEDWISAVQELQARGVSPRVVRVPKHFPGASGAFAELLPLLLAATGHRRSVTAGAAFTRATSPSAASPAAFTNTRVLAAVFCGEADSCDPAAAAAAAGTAREPSATSVKPKYPLTRMQNRCL